MSREPQGDGAAPAGVDGWMARVPARVVTGATDPHMRDHRSSATPSRREIEQCQRALSAIVLMLNATISTSSSTLVRCSDM